MKTKETSLKKMEDSSPKRDTSVESKSPPGQGNPKGKKRDFRIDIYETWCKACGICAAFCPTRVFTIGGEGYPHVANREACTGCGWCEIHCPDFAITVREKSTRAKPE
jgi:2-oxoglutarate ferredoxin oxidoreductase subunit delta